MRAVSDDLKPADPAGRQPARPYARRHRDNRESEGGGCESFREGGSDRGACGARNNAYSERDFV